ncbi:MAG: hypothetical protein AAF202_14285, partial [Pseudomonadota bacterium]
GLFFFSPRLGPLSVVFFGGAWPVGFRFQSKKKKQAQSINRSIKRQPHNRITLNVCAFKSSIGTSFGNANQSSSKGVQFF